jgi:hypothetical protein
MDVRSVQSSAVFTSTARNHSGHGTAEQVTALSAQGAPSSADSTPVLSADEQSFFEGLFPESRNDIRAYRAYSGSGGEVKSAVTGTLVDRKG